MHAVSVCFVIHRTMTRTTGSLTHPHDLFMHAYTHMLAFIYSVRPNGCLFHKGGGGLEPLFHSGEPSGPLLWNSRSSTGLAWLRRRGFASSLPSLRISQTCCSSALIQEMFHRKMLSLIQGVWPVIVSLSYLCDILGCQPWPSRTILWFGCTCPTPSSKSTGTFWSLTASKRWVAV